MISSESFKKEWIDSLRQPKKNFKINPSLIEKMIRAIALAEALMLEGLEFTFKGGTALVLLLQEPKRLSIDVDIVTQVQREKVESILNKISGKYGFNNWKLAENRSFKEDIPKAHYHLYYNSLYQQGGMNYIMLDVLYQENEYAEMKEIYVENKWVMTFGEITKILIPSENSILGDKLTAFAPNTSGILYNIGKEMEIIKQLFDVGFLFDFNTNFETTRSTFDRIVISELQFRGNVNSREQVLDDIIQTALILASREKQADEIDKEKYTELIRGIKQFRENLLFGKYRLEEAIESASKAAYLAAKIKVNNLTSLEKFDNKMKISDFMIDDKDFTFLNKLRNIPDNSALYYWNKTVEIIAS